MGKVLTYGSMQNGQGEYDRQLAHQLIDKLNQEASSGVKFDAKRLESEVWGGVCSAHSLSFVNDYLNSSLPEKDSIDLTNKITHIGENYKESSKVLRTYQAALNTIAKNPEKKCDDFMKAKIESLANLHNLEVSEASSADVYIDEEGYWDEIECCYKPPVQSSKFNQEVEKLPEGIFLVRAVDKNDNYKEEYYGHSMVYLNKGNDHFFFDPCGGTKQIDSKAVKQVLHECIASQCCTWGLNFPRFYKLEKKKSVPLTIVNTVANARIAA